MSSMRDEKRFKVFLAAGLLHSIMATCDRLHTACVIVKNKKIAGVGYNGSVSGLPHCDDEGHWIVDGHCERTRHGEENAISNTDRPDIRGAEAIVIATPCIRCMKSLIEEGVIRIYYLGQYENAKGKEFIDEMAKKRGVEMIPFDIDFEKLFQELFDDMMKKGGVLRRAGYGLKLYKTIPPEEEEKKCDKKKK